MGTLGLLGVRQGCQCVSFFPQLVPLITRNYLKQGFMEKTGPKVYLPLPGETFVAPVPVGSRAEFGRWENGEAGAERREEGEVNGCL